MSTQGLSCKSIISRQGGFTNVCHRQNQGKSGCGRQARCAGGGQRTAHRAGGGEDREAGPGQDHARGREGRDRGQGGRAGR